MQWLTCFFDSPQTMAKRPMSAVGNKRPVSEYARVAASMGAVFRYQVWLILAMIVLILYWEFSVARGNPATATWWDETLCFSSEYYILISCMLNRRICIDMKYYLD